MVLTLLDAQPVYQFVRTLHSILGFFRSIPHGSRGHGDPHQGTCENWEVNYYGGYWVRETQRHPDPTRLSSSYWGLFTLYCIYTWTDYKSTRKSTSKTDVNYQYLPFPHFTSSVAHYSPIKNQEVILCGYLSKLEIPICHLLGIYIS